jgi:hypothetical protein
MIESLDLGHADPNYQEPASDRPLTQSIIDAYYIYLIDIGSRDFQRHLISARTLNIFEPEPDTTPDSHGLETPPPQS